MHDPLDAQDLAVDELDRLEQSGHDVGALRAALASRAADAERILRDAEELERDIAWPWDERAVVTVADAAEPPQASDPDRVLGAWQGRIAGCMLGKPIETGTWSPAAIRAYLESVDAWPLRDWIPVDEGAAARLELKPCWTETTRGRVRGAARDDDIDWTILGLQLLERHGPSLTTEQVAAAWLESLPYGRVFTAERAVYANLLRGVPAGEAASRRNPYREWIGAAIRADAYGWAMPGRPIAAARACLPDALLSHRGNGLVTALWAAALVAASQAVDDPAAALEAALPVVPERTRLRAALELVATSHRQGSTWEVALERVSDRFGHYGWVHAVPNAAVIAIALAWSDGDFATAVGTAVSCGWDTDSTAATVGSVMGGIVGASALPARLVDPLEDRVRSAVFGADGASISELARRSGALAERFAEAGAA